MCFDNPCGKNKIWFDKVLEIYFAYAKIEVNLMWEFVNNSE